MNKFHAQKTVVDGITFHSKKESERFQELKLLFRGGRIFHLEIQPRFDFCLDGKKIFTYISDFQYQDENGETVIEDTKGYRTPLYKLKKRLIESQYKIRITET